MSPNTLWVATPPKLAPATYIREDSVPDWIPDRRNRVGIEPVFQVGGYGVYEHPVNGFFMVYPLGRPEGVPFVSVDQSLAEEVCEAWAKAFPPIVEFGDEL